MCLLNGQDDKRVVVVGAGFGGVRAAHFLRKQGFQVTLLDAKDYFEYTPSILRCFVDAKKSREVLFKHAPGTTVATVARVTASGVELQSGQVLAYDYCVVASGSAYSGAIKMRPSAPLPIEDRRLQLSAQRQRLAAAASVVVVGGGTTGVELVAEIAAAWPGQKKVTLLSSGSQLLMRLQPKMGEYAADWLRAHGVDVRLSERVANWDELPDEPGPAAVRLQGHGGGGSTGETIAADLVYKCGGAQAQPVEVEGASHSGIGELLVDENLQVSGCPRVFAIGDACSAPCEKSAFTAGVMAKLAADNVARAAKGRPLLPFPQGATWGRQHLPAVCSLSLGPRDGASQTNAKVDCGPKVAQQKAMVEALLMGVMAGSRLKTWLYDWVGAAILRFLSTN